jgi:hypothetical protein
MNGRIYDPMIGRFLQPDPIISEPYNSQNFNRYAYVLNNPLMYTDPSGYSTWTEVRGAVGAIAVTYILGPFGAFGEFGIAGAIGVNTAYAGTVSTIAAGFAAGGISGGNIESAIQGAFFAVALDGIGFNTKAGSIEQIAGHAIVGCMSAGVNGGNCGQAAIGAGFAAAAGTALRRYDIDNVFTRAAVGGAAASAAGGKFANGAFTAAFSYLLNDGAHSNNDDDIAENIKRDFGKGAWGAKKTSDGMAATGEVIEEVYKEAAIGKGIGVAGVVAKEVGLMARLKSFLGIGETVAEKAATNFSRELRASDLGIRGTVKELKGTFAVKDGAATMRVDNIVGKIENPLQVVGNMVNEARAAGASSLRIEGSLANDRLYDVLKARYGLTSSGATDSITIQLGRK